MISTRARAPDFYLDNRTLGSVRGAGRALNSEGPSLPRPDAYSADQPVYVSMEAELRRVCGAAVYDELADYCQARQGARKPRGGTQLPMVP